MQIVCIIPDKAQQFYDGQKIVLKKGVTSILGEDSEGVGGGGDGED